MTRDLDLTQELELYQSLADHPAFLEFLRNLENIEGLELTTAVNAKTPREETVALKTAKGLRIAIDFVPTRIGELRAEIKEEQERAKREEEEARKRLL